ncbi:MAG: HD domain-containing protein [Verrucomicrobiota bacterium]|nr:HD domain-containing protein [Verrucomicrobiota bacterium]
MATAWEFKIIRDPIHGYIGLTEQEVELLDTQPMQRLRRIKQLANAHLVYPGAVHTRFDHSLGTLHVAHRLACQLGFDESQTKLVRLAALVHDVGHAAFSHVGEKALLAFSPDSPPDAHQLVTLQIVQDHPEFKRVLGDQLQAVVECLNSKQPTVETAVVSGPLDADKLDYLLRDSYFAGVKYGVFDLERILHKVQVVRSGNESYIGVASKAKDALESYRLARYLMHAQVYQHHARLAADGMLIRAIRLAAERNKLPAAAFKLQQGKVQDLNQYLRFDDFTLLTTLRDCDDRQIAGLAQRLEGRRLFKLAWQLDLTEFKSRDVLASDRLNKLLADTRRISEVETSLAGEAGCAPEFVILMPQTIKNPLYRLPGTPLGDLGERLLIVADDGRTLPLDEISPLAVKSTLFSERLLLYGPEDFRQQLRAAAEAWLKSV